MSKGAARPITGSGSKKGHQRVDELTVPLMRVSKFKAFSMLVVGSNGMFASACPLTILLKSFRLLSMTEQPTLCNVRKSRLGVCWLTLLLQRQTEGGKFEGRC
jgi:hypothetical protein